MTPQEAYVAFNLTERVGSVTVDELIDRSGDVVAAWEGYPSRAARGGGEVDVAAEFRRAKEYGVRLLTPADEDYPRLLAETPGHPLCLYVKGDAKALSRPSVALVGTRRATSYGLDHAEELAHDLAAAGWSVVSGLALGIDAAAHRGALSAGGVTVGVLGSALDRFYPEENRALAREMVAAGGAVVSQFPFGRDPDRETFPIRNHVVAALTRGIVAVEAPLKSGTLITTGIAAELGRTVMALPARVDNRMSGGCLKLIRDGARLVRDADDVMEELSELLPRSTPLTAAPRKRTVRAARTAAEPPLPEVTLEEAAVLKAVDGDGVSLEKLLELTGFPPGKVNALCMTLRLKGRLRFLPGNRVALVAR